MIQLVNKSKCSGCSACYNACKVNALQMVEDKTGFWFPQIEKERCVECGACMKACPAMDKPYYSCDDPKAYIVQNKDDRIRRQSTSGGAFTGIARQIIAQGGVVFGAAIDENYHVSHIYVETEKGLGKFRSSKYVQSKIGSSYSKAESLLKSGRLVCFSGTPCQIYGLKKYLRKEYDNLITVDVMCRAVPSPKVLQKYLSYQREQYPEFDKIVFRDKGRGYSYSCVTLYQGKKVLYRGGSESDPWLRLFLGGYCNRETCHNCLYQTGVRASDITMWDCWGTQNYAPEWDDNKGTTNLIAWTKKGTELITNINSGLRVKESGINNIDASLTRSPLHVPNYNRNRFFDDCDKLTSSEFINKYAPMTFKIKLKRWGRETIYTLHLHNAMRKTVHCIRNVKKRIKR